MANNNSKVLSIRLQKDLLRQLEEQARIKKLTLSDFVRQELSQVEKRIRDNELLKNKIVILLRQIYDIVADQDKVDLSKYEELQAQNEIVLKEIAESKAKISVLFESNQQMKTLLDLKDYVLKKYEPDRSTEKELEPRVEKSENIQVEQPQTNIIDVKPEDSATIVAELPPGDQAEDDGNWNGL